MTERISPVSEALKVTGRLLASGRIPGQLIVQYTDRCNATCPQCGMRVGNDFTRTTLAEQRVAEMIRHAAQQGVAALSFTGGEPFLCLDEICRLATLAGDQQIRYIRTGTNGYLFRNAERADFADRMKALADKLAATPLRNIWVSIDSSDVTTHEQMRGLPGVIKGVEKALPIFAERGVYLSANLGINRYFAGRDKDREHLDYPFFRGGFDRFYRFVADLGFTIANVCYPMHGDNSSQAVYAATASDRVVYFSAEEKLNLFQALSDAIPAHREKIRIFTPRCSLHALLQQYRGHEELTTPCRGGRDYFFVDSRTGHSYPCGYRGEEDLGRFEEMPSQPCGAAQPCRRCDWECFRDPTELFSPLIDLRTAPGRLARRLWKDRDFYRLWREDLRYYRACDFFDGRRTLNQQALRPWRNPVLP
jgi:hypothetical protein